MTDAATELRQLSRLLDAFGADPRRWPVAERTRFGALITASPEARRLFDEARALDAVLAESEAEAAASPDLLDRIMRAAAATPQVAQKPPGNVIALPTRQPAPGRSTEQAPGRSAITRRAAQAATLLAASLAFGVYLGALASGSSTGREFADRLGVTALIEPSLLVLNEAGLSDQEDDIL
jgi:hypothetical protein